MRFLIFILVTGFFSFTAFSQRQLKGVVADSLTRRPLPFATIRAEGQASTFITGINGQFSFTISPVIKTLYVSYISYKSRSVEISHFTDHDTLFLSPAASTLGEVIVRSQTDKIKRIINTAISNKPLHNPEKYELYQCDIYYKMKFDALRLKPPAGDSTIIKGKPGKPLVKNKQDTSHAKDIRAVLRGNNHLLFSETYSRRYYRRPQQLQEIVLAARFSGLRKTYFPNLGTEIIPFHVYNDYITLNLNDYLNPIAKGWQQHYDFRLEDEISNGNDTVFILAFEPKKGAGFNSLKGLVYINSDGYAISHFIGTTSDTLSNREIKIEQVYNKKNGKWFPEELNYDVLYMISQSTHLAMRISGHSMVDSVHYHFPPGFRFDKAYPIKMHDSVDLRTEEEWQSMRMDSITVKEKNTYEVIDSISKKMKLEKVIVAFGKVSMQRLPLGVVDVDLSRLYASNSYEKTRAGIGLFTNEKLSRYYSIGGWAGYGFKDKKLKYGFSATVFPKGNNENWLRFSYQDDYQNAGNIFIHPEIDRSGYRNWLLAQPDRKREYVIKAHAQKGYWEIDVNGMKQKLTSLYTSNFEFAGKQYTGFDVQEASIGLRYAYGQKRLPFFGYYFPTTTKYPIIYFRSAIGKVKSGDYAAGYVRVLTGLTYNKHLNRWGNDAIRLEAGFIHSFDNKPFSRSFLLAAKGFRREGINYYAWGGFLTMRPYDYYSDSYASLLYKHDFDKRLWRLKWSNPFIGIGHNVMYSGLAEEHREANAGIASPTSGYHESGVLLNHIVQLNLGTTYLYLNGGAFYHWTRVFDWQRNGVWVIGLSAGF